MAERETGLDEEIRGLYQGPLEELTPARNALAARLKKEKRTEDAARVKSLRKPTPSAWAVNRLFAREPKKMTALLEAGRLARSAQGEAVSGLGAEAMRKALKDARHLSDELRGDAVRILTEEGRSPGRDLVDRIAANLQALAFSPSVEAVASRGWLDADLDPPGFEVLAGLQLAGTPPIKKEEAPEPAPPPAKGARPTSKKDEEERKKREAAEQAQRRIAVAREAAEKARVEAEASREEAEKAEAAAEEARRHAEEKEKAAARARECQERAAERLARAEAALREAMS